MVLDMVTNDLLQEVQNTLCLQFLNFIRNKVMISTLSPSVAAGVAGFDDRPFIYHSHHGGHIRGNSAL